jgi:hypothetical protein
MNARARDRWPFGPGEDGPVSNAGPANQAPDTGKPSRVTVTVALELTAFAMWPPAAIWVFIAKGVTNIHGENAWRANRGLLVFLAISALLILGLPGTGALIGRRLGRRRHARCARLGAAVGALTGATLLLAITLAGLMAFMTHLNLVF